MHEQIEEIPKPDADDSVVIPSEPIPSEEHEEKPDKIPEAVPQSHAPEPVISQTSDEPEDEEVPEEPVAVAIMEPADRVEKKPEPVPASPTEEPAEAVLAKTAPTTSAAGLVEEPANPTEPAQPVDASPEAPNTTVAPIKTVPSPSPSTSEPAHEPETVSSPESVSKSPVVPSVKSPSEAPLSPQAEEAGSIAPEPSMSEVSPAPVSEAHISPAPISPESAASSVRVISPTTTLSEPEPAVEPEPLPKHMQERQAMAEAEAVAEQYEEEHAPATLADLSEEKAAAQARVDEEQARRIEEDAELISRGDVLSVAVYIQDRPDTFFYAHMEDEANTVMDLKLAIGRATGVLFSKQKLFRVDYAPLANDKTVLRELVGFEARPIIRLFGASPMPIRALVEHTVETPKRSAERNWLIEFEQIWDLIDGSGSIQHLDAEKALIGLNKEFEQAATNTIRSISAGTLDRTPCDLWTGETYAASGLMVIKAGHWSVAGQDTGVGDVAFHLAGHEQRMIDQVRALHIPRLLVPPCLTIDYLGNRYLVTPTLPVSSRDLAYGSDSGTLLVTTDDEDALRVAHALKDALNLADHTVVQTLPGQFDSRYTDRPGEIRADGSVAHICPISAETRLYKTKDGAFIPVNLAANLVADLTAVPASGDVEEITLARLSSVLRPDHVARFTYEDQLQPGFELFKSLDPRVCDICGQVINEYEFLTDGRDYDVHTYCADSELSDEILTALRRTYVPEDQRATYWKNAEGEVTEVKPTRLTPVNPDLAQPRSAEVIREETGDALESEEDLALACAQEVLTSLDQLIDAINSQAVIPLTPQDVVTEMHARGINVRLLGLMPDRLEHPFAAEIVVREIVVRTAKVLLRDTLAEKAEADAKEVAAGFLNLLIAPVEEAPENAVTLWAYIAQLAAEQFKCELDHSVRDRIWLPGLLQRVCWLNGITLDISEVDLNDYAPITVENIVEISSVPKVNTVLQTEALVMLDRALETDAAGRRSKWHLPGGPERESATAMFRDAVNLCVHLYGADLDDTSAVDVLLAAAEHCESRHCEAGRPENSRWNKCAGVKPSDLSAEAMGLLNRAVGVLEHVKFPSYLNDNVTLKMCTSAHALARLMAMDDLDGALTNFDRAIDCAESVIGFQHPATAALYLELALALQEAGRVEHASFNVRRAFVGYVRTVGLENSATKRCHKMLCQIETQNDSGLQDVPLEFLADEIEKLELEQM
ncbi:eukaryotic translation initiation factor 3 subunit eif-3 [Carpediemonas membranifera]|uniref:Eukaryotic translation initiation factor 3 subunit eif-3 n=1 Tax=Carpediemonas membranifera TaxID=201153 RepID=A0A8J6E4R1_9EUKA|nr:eukaryotic translation initiation factor 3 subunit eif-3 [Carpediemonas membranifera]|eukprot:KAG9397508.1 eukaryotic translation initiation factor 3 subunit eif-3 [Carpediemonas membranifera]